jgi:hypothetical protein
MCPVHRSAWRTAGLRRIRRPPWQTLFVAIGTARQRSALPKRCVEATFRLGQPLLTGESLRCRRNGRGAVETTGREEAMGATVTTRSPLTRIGVAGNGSRSPTVTKSAGLPVIRLVVVVVLALLTWLTIAPSARAEPSVEHSGKATFVDPTFSDFLTQSCGFAVLVTDTESDTLLDNGTVFVLSIHISADVVGNGQQLLLRTDSPLIISDRNNLTVGMIVQVRSATNQLLVQYGGQLRILDDGSNVFHPAFPQFNLCDYLR